METANSVSATTRLGLTEDGTLYTWGNNEFMMVGDGSATNRNVIHRVDVPPVRDFSLGGVHTVAITLDGRIFTWGLGNHDHEDIIITLLPAALV